jgi:hypothetical protein
VTISEREDVALLYRKDDETLLNKRDDCTLLYQKKIWHYCTRGGCDAGRGATQWKRRCGASGMHRRCGTYVLGGQNGTIILRGRRGTTGLGKIYHYYRRKIWHYYIVERGNSINVPEVRSGTTVLE